MLKFIIVDLKYFTMTPLIVSYHHITIIQKYEPVKLDGKGSHKVKNLNIF